MILLDSKRINVNDALGNTICSYDLEGEPYGSKHIRLNSNVYLLPMKEDNHAMPELAAQSTLKKRLRATSPEEGPSRKKRKPNDTGLSSAVCWRIDPTIPGYYQLLDAEDNVTHSALVKTQYGERKLSQGYLKVKGLNLKRHSADTASLEKNGFSPGQQPRIFKKNTASLVKTVVYADLQNDMSASEEELLDEEYWYSDEDQILRTSPASDSDTDDDPIQ